MKRTHGKSASKEYAVWLSMKARCHRTTDRSYTNYGGRGIKVCDEWFSDFEHFYKDMGNCPENHCLDRINNNEGYSKENCHWVTAFINNRNKRNNRYYFYDGQYLVLDDIALKVGIPQRTLKARIETLGWSFDNAISKPVWKGFVNKCNNGHDLLDGSYTISGKGKKRCKQCQHEYDLKRRPKRVN